MAKKKISLAAVAAATAPEDDFVKAAPKSAGTKVEKAKRVRVSLDLPPELHKAVKLAAVKEGVSIIDYLNRVIEKEMKE